MYHLPGEYTARTARPCSLDAKPPTAHRPGTPVRERQSRAHRLALKGGQGVQIFLVGVDKAALAGQGSVVLVEVAVVAAGVAVGALQDRQAEGAVLLYHAGDAGGVVGAVGS